MRLTATRENVQIDIFHIAGELPAALSDLFGEKTTKKLDGSQRRLLSAG